MNRTVKLTTIGSRNVELEITPATLAEASGGCTMWVRRRDGWFLDELAVAMTADEVEQLVAAIADVIASAPLELENGGPPA